jgi:serine protease Do
MDDLNLIEAVEKYISGGMTPDERVYFEQLRKTNPEVDQLVVEHTFFMQQLNRYDQTRRIKSQLNDIHIDLAEKGAISSTRLQGSAKIAYLYKRYKRVAAIAASIAGITAIAISVLFSSVGPGNANKDLQVLVGKVEDLEEKNKDLEEKNKDNSQEIDSVKAAINSTTTLPKVIYKAGGTGFMVDASGYLVTNAHVVAKGNSISVQDVSGNQFKANIAFVDNGRDLAILKISDDRWRSPGTIPYAITKRSTDIAEPIFTLGYPRNEIVYGEGYLAASTGYNGDTLSCQIAIAANPGNSGGPILNHNGEVIGILNARQTTAEGVVFAIHSKYIYEVISQLQKKDTTLNDLKIPANSSVKSFDRTNQVKKIKKFVYRVKVS